MIFDQNKKQETLNDDILSEKLMASEKQDSESGNFAEIRRSKKYASVFLRVVLFAFFCCVFFILFYLLIESKYFDKDAIKTVSDALWFCIIFTSLFVLSLLLLYTVPGIKSFTCLFILSLFAIVYFFANLTFFDFIPNDTKLNFIPLIETFSGATNLTIEAYSYTSFSQSLLFAFSKLPLPAPYIARILSVPGNILLACGLCSIHKMWNDNIYANLSVLAGTMFLPHLILPFSFEFSLFAAFAVFAIYYLINAKPYTASVYLALSLSLSKAGILLLALILIMMFVRQFKIRHAVLFLIFFALSFVPPYLLGANLFSSAMTYAGDLYAPGNFYTPGLYAFFGDISNNYMTINLSVCLTAAFVLSVISYSFVNRNILDQRSVISIALILFLGTAYLLSPLSIYCFMFAAVLGIAYLSLGKQKIYISVIILICTFIPLCVSLFDLAKTPVMFCSVGIIAAVTLIVRELLTYINNEKIKLHSVKEI